MNWQAELKALLGNSFNDDEACLRAHSSDKWHASCMPEVVVLARNTEDVCTTLRFANEHSIPVTARGAGVGYVGGCVPLRGGIVLSLAKMTRIIDIRPQDGLAIVEAGVLTAELQDACTALGWFYPPDPASRKESSLGGNIATNAGGPRCLKYGVTRNYVLGLSVVLADGSCIKVGGLTHKNKQGFDLVSLFCGSEGLLGIITEATLRIIPSPPARLAMQAFFPQFAFAAKAVQEILQAGHLPAAMEITDAFTLQAARNYLGADALPANMQGHMIIEIDGQIEALAAEGESIRRLLESCGAQSCEIANSPEQIELIWQRRREFSYSLKATGLKKLNEDIVIPRSQLVELVSFCGTLQKRSQIPVACFGHAGDGNIHTNIMVPLDAAGNERSEEAHALVDELFAWVLAHGGSITGEHGIGIAKEKWFEEAIGKGSFSLHQKLKQTLDPKGILNPSKMKL